MNTDSDDQAASIPRAAKQLGIDSFSLYGLIQRDKVRPQRARWGDLVILQIEMDRVTTAADTDKKKGR